MTSISVSAARAELPALLALVESGDEVTITRHGRPVAVLVRPDALRTRRATEVFAEAKRIRALVEAAKETPVANSPGMTIESAEALIAHIRAGREDG
jgi:prevent-host-death family protein